jgi:hypothetical protein
MLVVWESDPAGECFMISNRNFKPILSAIVLGLVVACSDTNSPDQPDLSDVTFGLQRSEATSARISEFLLLSANGQSMAIAPDTVASLTITVDGIQALPLLNDNEEEDDAAWVSIDLAQPVAIDFTALPTTDESPLILASGTLAEGGYTNVRLFVSGAVIVFKGPLDLGAAISFAGNVEHAVTIPSVEQTGIKTDMAFNVLADTEVTLVFDEAASYSNVTLTGNGQVILAPVIRSSGN